MKLIGVDYGRAKLGIAYSESFLAAPLMVIKVINIDEALNRISGIIAAEKPDKVIVGVSEGEMGKEQESFAKSLEELLVCPVETWDEGLSSFDANLRSQESGIKRKKRREMEDAYAATVMLQSYLDGKDTRSV